MSKTTIMTGGIFPRLFPLLLAFCFFSSSSSAAPKSVNCTAKWADQNLTTGDVNQVFTCPSNCTGGGGGGEVFGDVIYHKDSSLCLSAIHAGAFPNDAGGDFFLTCLSGVDSYANVTKNGVTSESIAGNKGDHESAFLARPFAVEEASVKVEAKTNEITVKQWEAADHAVSYDEFVVFKTFANVSDFEASATPECNVTKDLKCVIDTAVTAGTIYHVYVATKKTKSFPLKTESFLSTSSPTRIMTKPAAAKSVSFTEISSSGFVMSFDWDPAKEAVQEAKFIGKLAGEEKVFNSTPTKQLVFTSLIGGTIYNAGVQVEISDSDSGGSGSTQRSVGSTTRQQITKPKTPSWVEEPRSNKPGQLSLSWDIPDTPTPKGNWSEFQLTYREENQTGYTTETYDKQKTKDNILGGLKSGRFYSLKLRSGISWKNDDGNTENVTSEYSEEKLFIPTKPEQPEQLFFSEITSESFKFEWKQVPDRHLVNGSWDVWCCLSSDSNQKVIDEKNHLNSEIVAKSLQPGVEYECKVTAVFAGLKSETALKSQLTAPGVVQNLRKKEQKADALTIEWDAPNGQVVEDYVVEYRLMTDSIFITNTTNETVIDIGPGLEAGSEYFFQLTTQNSAGKSSLPPENITVFTRPNPAEDLNITERTSDSITIVWYAPSAGDFEAFRAASEGTPLRVERNDSLPFYSEKFSLNPGKEFSFEVTTLVGVNLTSDSESTSGWTLPGKASDLHISELNETSFEVKWKKPDGEVTEYLVFVAKVVQNGAEDWRSVANVTDTQTPVDNLVCGTHYFLKIVAQRENDTSDLYETVEQWTKPCRPDALDVETLSSSSLKAVWTSPSEGSIDGYEIRIENDTAIVGELVLGSGNESYIFESLDAGTNYSLHLNTFVNDSSSNGGGSSGSSSSSILKSEEVSSSNVTLPGKVRNPLYEDVTTHGLTVEWEKPEKGAVDNYFVQYRLDEKGETEDWVSMEMTNQLERQIVGLNSSTDYVVRITSSLGSHLSDKSETINVTTTPEVGQISIRDYGEAFVSLDLVGPGHGRIDYFYLVWKKDGSEEEKSEKIDFNGTREVEYNITTDLNPGSLYLFTLTIICNNRNSSSTEEMQRLLPLPVNSLIESESTTSLTVNWTMTADAPPLQSPSTATPTGEFSGFRLSYCRQDDCQNSLTNVSGNDLPKDQRHYLIANLQAGRVYQTFLTVLSAAEKSSEKTEMTVLYPKKPNRVAVNNVSPLNVRVNWTSGDDSHQDKFVITAAPFKNPSQTKDVGAASGNETEKEVAFNSSSFKPGQKIIFGVYGVVEAKTVEGNSLDERVGEALEMKQILQPGRVEDEREEESMHDSLTISWKAPSNGFFSGYKISWVVDDATMDAKRNYTDATCTENNCAESYKIDRLHSAAVYNITIQAVVKDEVDSLEASGEVAFLRLRTDPGTVENIQISQSTRNPTLVNVTWKTPLNAFAEGNFDSYVVKLFIVNSLKNDDDDLYLKNNTISSSEQKTQFDGLEGGTLYKVTVVAVFEDNQAGVDAEKKFRTYPNPISELTEFKAEGGDVIIAWKRPEGAFKNIMIRCLVDEKLGTEDPDDLDDNCNNKTVGNESNGVTFENMRPASTFSFVILVNSDADLQQLSSTEYKGSIESPAGKPPPAKAGSKPQRFEEAGNSSATLEVDCDWFPGYYGKVVYYTILGVSKGEADKVDERTVPITWSAAQREEAHKWPLYRLFEAKKCRASASSSAERRRRSTTMESVMVGTAENCSSESAPEFCDGPLLSGSSYQFRFRGFTDDPVSNPGARFADTAFSNPVNTKPSMVTLTYKSETDVIFVNVSDFRFKNINVTFNRESTTDHSNTINFADFEKEKSKTIAIESIKDLQVGTRYTVTAQAISFYGARSAKASMEFQTKSPAPVAVIVGVVVGIIFVLIFVVFAWLLLDKRRRDNGGGKTLLPWAKRQADPRSHITIIDQRTTMTNHRRSSTSGSILMTKLPASPPIRPPTPEKPASIPIALKLFPDYVADGYKDSNMKFALQYEDLKMVGRDQSVEHALMVENRPKNRFTNILPYDHSRVKLLPVDDDEASDYINANYMPGYNSPREYIVCQGPLASTAIDFWRLVWEQNVQAIVMVTRCQEKSREKCFPYWPMETQTPVVHGDLEVTSLSYQDSKDWRTTQINIDLGDMESRKLPHYNYTAWPDFGVPKEPASLVAFVRTVRARVKRGKGPVLVHCSAGVGRSGTWIGLDWALQHTVEHDTLDLFGIVYRMRKNRTSMVQTENQYIFLHECVSRVLLEEAEAEEEHFYANVNHAFEPDEGICDSPV